MTVTLTPNSIAFQRMRKKSSYVFCTNTVQTDFDSFDQEWTILGDMLSSFARLAPVRRQTNIELS